MREAATQPVAKTSESLYAGRRVGNAAQLSGVWEAPDGQGGFVGLQLYLLTSIPSDRTTVAGSEQTWDGLDAMLYERTGSVATATERNSFTDTPRGGSLRYEGDHLLLHAGGFDLDLKRGRDDSWTGRFHRPGFDRRVTLRRPVTRTRSREDWFLGTWMTSDSNTQTCLHLGRTEDGSYLGWTDELTTLGQVRFGPRVSRPVFATERYGALAAVKETGANQVQVDLNVEAGSCCPKGFLGTGRGDGSVVAEWHGGQPGALSRNSVWRPVAGNSCVAAR